MLPWGSFNPQVLGAVPSSVVFSFYAPFSSQIQPSWLQPSTFVVDSRAKAHECSLTAGHSGCRLAVLPQRLRPTWVWWRHWHGSYGSYTRVTVFKFQDWWRCWHESTDYRSSLSRQSLRVWVLSAILLFNKLYFTNLFVFQFDLQCPLTARCPFSGKFRRSLLSTTTTWLQCGAVVTIDWRHFQSSMQTCSELDMLQSYSGRQL